MPIAASCVMVRCVLSADAWSGSSCPVNDVPSQASRCALVEDVPFKPKFAGFGIGSELGAPASISGRP